jgi:hypothetical protein
MFIHSKLFKIKNIYTLAFFLQAIVIVVRFLIFNAFLSFDNINKILYAEFTFYTSIIPVLTLGTIFSQNALYTRYLLDQKHLKTIKFYQNFTLIFILLSMALLLVSFATTMTMIAIAFTVVSYNILTAQIRAEKLILSNYQFLIEVVSLTIFLIYLPKEWLFNAFAIYYAFVMMIYLLFSKKILRISFKALMDLKIILMNLKIFSYGAPTYIKDFIDVMILGFIASDADKLIYATIILFTAPAKILYSLLYQILYKYLVDIGKYFGDLRFQNNIITKIIISLCLTLISALAILTLNHDLTFFILILLFLRNFGIIFGGDLRGNFLDNIQKRQDLGYPYGFIAILLFVCCLLFFLFYYTKSLIFLATCPLLISICYSGYYKKRIVRSGE